ncbi:MAG: nuclear transport factor 2 family protein [Bacteroidota bacterium]
MKIHQTIFVLFGICMLSCQTEKKVDHESLKTAIETFNRAFSKGDLVVLDSMITPNYLHTNSSSKVIGKESWFNYLEKRNKRLESGEIEVLDYTLDETKIEYHGNSAIVTGRVTVMTKDSLGTKQNQYRITNLWVYENGKWKRAGFHDGKIQ